MKKIVSFSGGRTSAYLCHLMIEKFGRENVDFIYMDTGAEHPKTYEFIKQVDKHFGLNLACLKVDINPELGKGNTYKVVDIDDCKCDLKPWVDMTSKYGTPYIHGAFCTDRMKTTPFKKYCDDTYGKKNYETWLGIRIDEEKRLKNPKFKYLAEISDFDKQDVLNWWSKQDFDLAIDEWLGNCVFCLKKGVNKIALAIKDEPELYQQFNSMLKMESVRKTEIKYGTLIMYRGNNSLESIYNTYENSSRTDIAQTVRSAKTLDANSCSESCEVFQLDWIED